MTDYALVKSNVVKYVARQTTAPNAQSEGVDLVEDVTGIRCEPGWIRSGVRQYAKPPPSAEETNAAQVDADILSAFQAMKDYRALSAPTTAQRNAWEDLVATTLIRLGRKALNRFEAAD